MPRTTLVLACSAVLALLLVAPAAQAQTSVTLTAQEGPDCPVAEQQVYCFTVTEGDLSNLTAGQTLNLTLVNAGQLDHNVLVAPLSEADPSHMDTPADAAIAESDTIGAGEETNLTLEVPQDVEGLYLWCEVGNHEQMGMWLEAQVATGDNDTEPPANNTTDDGPINEGPDEDGIPGPGALAALVVSGTAALVVRRRVC